MGGLILATPTHLVSRSKSHVRARTDRSENLSPAGEAAGRSRGCPLSTSIRLMCKVIAVTKTSRAASAPRMTSSSSGICKSRSCHGKQPEYVWRRPRLNQ
jgi:hypothetical protein